VEWDDDAPDDESASPLLPPDDRLWRHPSEIAVPPAATVRGFVAHRANPLSAPAPAGPPRVVTVVALTSCISVLLTLGVVALVRPFRESAAEAPAASPSPSLTGSEVAALAEALRPAIAQVIGVGADSGRDRVGSGVLFREDGLLLTAQHLVSGATDVRVLLDDGRSLVARVVGTDDETDIAVLDVDGSSFPVAPLAPASSSVAVGDDAITIGSAGPASPVVRVSMVSAVGQEAGLEGHKLMDVIRIDEAMAAGTSGGAVVDRAGRVVAIAAANIASASDEVGYAIPIAVARAVADELLASGRVVRGWLGIEGESRAGALVHRVKPGSPAEAAGLSTGDVIVAIDGVTVATMSALVSRLRQTDPGDSVSLSVRRGDQTVTVAATLAEQTSG
jgi:S1-C subfamily serine protease